MESQPQIEFRFHYENFHPWLLVNAISNKNMCAGPAQSSTRQYQHWLQGNFAYFFVIC